ncbi:daptide-type RiPP biosynthesis methyltransferase [Arthrobacter sp. MMS24-S77]
MRTATEKTADDILRAIGHEGPPEDLYGIEGSRLYDRLTSDDLSELPEILRAVRKTAGPILELAAGSGRITRALLALGRPLTAVDSSAEMLEMLRERAETRSFNPRGVALDIVEADMSQLPVGGTYGCIVLGASSVTLLTPDQRRALFQRVHDCLAPGGCFVLTVLDAGVSDQSPEDHDGTTSGYSVLDANSILFNIERRDPDRGTRHVTMIKIDFDEGKSYRTAAYVSDVAYVRNEVIEAELSAEGLSVLERRAVRIASPVPSLNKVEMWVCGK